MRSRGNRAGDPEAEPLRSILLENMTTRERVRPAPQRRLAGLDSEKRFRRMEPGVQVPEKGARDGGLGNGLAEAPHSHVPDRSWLCPTHRP